MNDGPGNEKTNPAPAPVGGAKSPFTAEGVRDYERRRYRSFDQRWIHARETRLVVRHFREAGWEEGRNLSVLDLPCGYGRFSPLLLRLGARLLNSDLSLEMVRRAVEKSLRPGVVADATAGLPFRSGTIDAVFSMRLFHHIHDADRRRAILGEFGRVSAGFAVVSYYRSNALHKAQRALRRLRRKTSRKINMIDAATFRAEAESAGWTIARDVPLLRGLHAARITLLKKSAG